MRQDCLKYFECVFVKAGYFALEIKWFQAFGMPDTGNGSFALEIGITNLKLRVSGSELIMHFQILYVLFFLLLEYATFGGSEGLSLIIHCLTNLRLMILKLY